MVEVEAAVGAVAMVAEEEDDDEEEATASCVWAPHCAVPAGA